MHARKIPKLLEVSALKVEPPVRVVDGAQCHCRCPLRVFVIIRSSVLGEHKNPATLFKVAGSKVEPPVRVELTT